MIDISTKINTFRFNILIESHHKQTYNEIHKIEYKTIKTFAMYRAILEDLRHKICILVIIYV